MSQHVGWVFGERAKRLVRDEEGKGGRERVTRCEERGEARQRLAASRANGG